MKRAQTRRPLRRALGAALFCCWLAGCASTPSGPPAGAVAVWDLDDLGVATGEPGLGEVAGGAVIETLKNRGYPVVERQRLLLLLDELNLGSGALADETTRLRLGRLSGARRMVFGGYQGFGAQVRVDLRLVDVETGKVVRAARGTASAAGLRATLDAVSQAAEALVKNSP